jgi:hypothetical protein
MKANKTPRAKILKRSLDSVGHFDTAITTIYVNLMTKKKVDSMKTGKGDVAFAEYSFKLLTKKHLPTDRSQTSLHYLFH